MKDVMGWQRRFRAAPSVWAVLDRDGSVLNLYESKEAAMEELRFNERNGRRRYSSGITEMHVHTLDLARERWSDAEPSPVSTETKR